MTNKEIESKLREELEAMTPNNFDEIFNKCQARASSFADDTESTATILHLPAKKKSRLSTYRRALSMVAVFALVFTLGVSAITGISMNVAESTIALDVNPSIEITLTRAKRIKSVKAINDDGVAILDGMDVKNKKIDEALELIVDELVAGGYISENANSILVSIDSNGDTSALQEQLTNKIKELLSADGLKSSVLAQKVSKDNRYEEIKALADKYKISIGKARLVYELVEKDGRHTFEELSSLNINDLSILLNDTNLMPKDVKHHGEASRKAYISEADALNKALANFNVNKADARNMEIELDFDRGSMIYDVEFESNGKEYECDVDAKTGAIRSHQNGDITPEASPMPRPESRPADMIGKEKALEAASKDCGIPLSELKDAHTDVKFKNGKWVYEIELRKGGEHTRVMIDAENGTIIQNP